MTTLPLLPSAKKNLKAFDDFDASRLFTVLSEKLGTSNSAQLGNDFVIAFMGQSTVSYTKPQRSITHRTISVCKLSSERKVLPIKASPIIEVTRSSDGTMEAMFQVGARPMQQLGRALKTHGMS